MSLNLTVEFQCLRMAADARDLADTETNPYERRRLLLLAQHYDGLAELARQAAERRKQRKSA